MEFGDVASFFDNDPIYDGVSGAFLFDGQVASFNDPKSDGSSNRRRTLSLAAGLVLPSHGTLSIYDERWLAGLATPDGFQGEVVRQSFNMKRVTDLFTILTPQQAVLAQTGTTAYVHKLYFKDTVNSGTDSDYDTFWNVFLAPSVAVPPGTFFKDAGGTYYRVRKAYMPLEELQLAQSDELDAGARVSVTLTGNTYDPVSDSYSGSSSSVYAIKLDAVQFFRFRAVSDSQVHAGDATFFFAASAGMKQGQTFAVGSVTWRVISVQSELDAVVVHARRA